MKFVDRVSELAALEDHLARNGPQLLRVYGRRRLGKTELLRKLCERTDGIYLLIDDADQRQLLDSLSRQLASEAGGLRRPYRTWDAFLDHLGTLDAPVVVLDEFQRLVANDPQALTRLQDRWDRGFGEEGPAIILCGSSVGMMQRLTEGRQGPLFGRLTGDLRLRPFPYGAVRLLYPDLDEAERVVRFAVFGGTPHYHQFSVDASLEEAVRRSFLQTTAPFQEEPQSLLSLELKKPTRYNSILFEIGQGTHSLRELESKVGVSKGGLGPYIETLRDDLDLIDMEDPVCGKRRKARYVFADPFFAFYYRFVFANRPRIELGRAEPVWQEIQAQLNAHVGLQFEEVVKDTLELVNGGTLQDIPVEFAEIGRWWNRVGDELDVVAKGPEEVLAGEVKWSSKPVGVDVVHETLRRIELLERTDDLPVRPLVAARGGLTEDASELLADANGLSITLEDIGRVHEERFPRL